MYICVPLCTVSRLCCDVYVCANAGETEYVYVHMCALRLSACKGYILCVCGWVGGWVGLFFLFVTIRRVCDAHVQNHHSIGLNSIELMT